MYYQLNPSLLLVIHTYSLRCDKHHSNPTLCRSPVEMLNLWKSCVLPHFLLYLRYISDASQLQVLQASLDRSLSTTLHVYGHPTTLLAEAGIPPLYITQNLQLAQLRFRLHSSPPATIQHFLWQLGSLYYNLCPSTQSKPACRLQYVTWIWPTVILLPLCPKM